MAQDVFGIVGSVIAGAYHVEKVVAEGGFGVVYRAHHGGFRAPVALKCLKVPQHLNDQHQATFLEQFRAEAELMFRLSASLPTVVRPLHVDAMTTPDGSFVPFMVLEWLEGETLDGMIRRRYDVGEPPMPAHRLVNILTPVARALEKAHHFAGPNGIVCIVHRDLKPENIFVARVAGDEVVKILDFGIGKVKSVANQVAGRASQEAGGISSFTPAYGAPEQWVPKKLGQTGPWTDVWGLALTMVEALVGYPVIDGDHQAIMGTTLDPARRPTPRAEGIELGDAAERVFAKALAVDPRERYGSAGDFWNDLLAALDVDENGKKLPPKSPAPSETRVAGTPQGARTPPSVPSLRPGAPGGVENSSLAMDLSAQPLSQRSGAVSETRFAGSGAGGEIPDLDVARARPDPTRLTGGDTGNGHRNREFEEVPASGFELALDLPEDDEFHRRSSPGRGPSSLPPLPAASPSTTGSFPPSSKRPPEPRGAVTPSPSLRPPMAAAGQSRSSLAPAQRAMPSLGSVPPAEQTMFRRMLPGLILVGLSIVITIADQAYSAATTEMFTLGPLRATWIAAVLLFAGLGLLAYRALPRS
ncbi:MAG TPA: protein kinase [Polyangiaceae bacterium]|nr:protein kinase [Polyangiaceae bacterium]